MGKITLFIIISMFTWAGSETHASSANPLLQCLGAEESRLHKEKSQGALYRLNQEFINELASSNDISLKKHFVDEVCNSKIHSPSVALLRLLLLVESDIYDLSLSQVDPSMRSFKMGYINEFQKQTPRLLVQYLAALQAEMPTADCLVKAIPELKIFFERLKYLEEEMAKQEVTRDKDKIEKIFKKLEKIKEIRQQCEQEFKSKKSAAKVKDKRDPQL